jgi:hypothetical protein
VECDQARHLAEQVTRKSKVIPSRSSHHGTDFYRWGSK